MRKRIPGLLLLAFAILPLVGCMGGLTPLHRAARAGDLDAAEKALLRGIEANVRDNAGNTPLHYAAQRSIDRLIPAAGAPAGGVKDLVKAAGTVDELLLLKALLANGADPNAVNRDGLTPLHVAAEHNSAHVALVLIGAGADPNARDKINRTPLEIATRAGYRRLVDVLEGMEIADPSTTQGVP